ncbi:helix-turn-helix transcriptional regulator [Mesorhizobium sp. M0659]|uniref:winged helix-turn-helix transcriptional regulator n=1 Tax=Mesorhizobium sp. M0659 TaxID=2956980 RepID=UPI00333509C0
MGSGTVPSISGIAALEIPSPRHPSECPVEDWLSFLGHRWNALILWHLSTGDKRFSELMTVLPHITSKVMTDRLRALMERDLISRSAVLTFPRTTTYQITARGRALTPILDQIEQWAAKSHRAVPPS